jgi:hypothetical protein
MQQVHEQLAYAIATTIAYKLSNCAKFHIAPPSHCLSTSGINTFHDHLVVTNSNLLAASTPYVYEQAVVEMTRFQLKPGTAADFERRWQQQADGAMCGAAAAGFKFSTVLR